MRVFAFVLRQKADFPVKTLCRVCRVSTSGFYDWAGRQAAGPSAAEAAEADLVERIRLVHPSPGAVTANRVSPSNWPATVWSSTTSASSG